MKELSVQKLCFMTQASSPISNKGQYQRIVSQRVLFHARLNTVSWVQQNNLLMTNLYMTLQSQNGLFPTNLVYVAKQISARAPQMNHQELELAEIPD